MKKWLVLLGTVVLTFGLSAFGSEDSSASDSKEQAKKAEKTMKKDEKQDKNQDDPVTIENKRNLKSVSENQSIIVSGKVNQVETDKDISKFNLHIKGGKVKVVNLPDEDVTKGDKLKAQGLYMDNQLQAVKIDVASKGKNHEKKNEDQKQEKTNDTKKQGQSTSDQNENKSAPSVEDKVTIDGLKVKITSATFTKPNEYIEAKKGSVLTLEITAKNVSDESKFVDGTDFTMSTNGNMQKEYLGYDEMIVSGEVTPGNTITGKLYFDIPNTDEYKLLYQPEFGLSEEKVEWEIPKSDIQYP